MSKNWRSAFPARILERGADYAAAELVCELERTDDGWKALVAGTEDYRVRVTATLDPHEAACTCPHFADGNLCKHIAAVLFAIEESGEAAASADKKSKAGKKAAEPAPETVGDILVRLSEADLRDFLADAISRDDALERRLRARFGRSDAKQAKRDLQQATTDLMRRHERGGFIDWRHAMDFECDYNEAVGAIIEPLLSARDVDALIELAIVRLVQLQRICIDDSDGFFTDAMYSVAEHIRKTYQWGSAEQRTNLFDALRGFLEKNPGRDRGDVYWFEKETVEELIGSLFAGNKAFAPALIAFTEERIAALPPDLHGPHDYDYNKSEREQWQVTRLRALAASGAAYAELQAAAESLLDRSEALQVLVDACLTEGRAADAADLLRGHLNARSGRVHTFGNEKLRPTFDQLIDIVKAAGDARELAETYTALLLAPPRDAREGDRVGWYKALPSLMGDVWPHLRAKLLADMPADAAQECLAGEGALDELFEHIMAHDGRGLSRYERELIDDHPEAYVDLYMRWASERMERAGDRKGYRSVAEALAHAAGIEGGQDRAEQYARDLRERFPRRPALLDELTRAGFSE